MAEKVLVVSREALGALLKQGFFDEEGPAILNLISSSARFLDRGSAEDDPSLKQIIPYVLVCHNGQFLAYRRTEKQGENRLHNKLSIGFGGHINPSDTADLKGENIVLSGLVRELNEEVFIKAVGELAFVGFINDDSNAVGQVHLGVVFRLTALTPDFEVNEPDQIEAEWRSPQDIAGLSGGLETWSQILFESYVLKGDA